MRDIKFRYWNGDKILNQESIINHLNKYIAKNDKHLMQYTGLKDKNGIEIYEGDVVKTKNSGYRVIFDKCCFWGVDELGKYPIYQIYNYVLDDEEFEVIGNIYEN